jgi:uncharacterized protein (DUF39 family)
MIVGDITEDTPRELYSRYTMLVNSMRADLHEYMRASGLLHLL